MTLTIETDWYLKFHACHGYTVDLTKLGQQRAEWYRLTGTDPVAAFNDLWSQSGMFEKEVASGILIAALGALEAHWAKGKRTIEREGRQ